MTVKVTLNCQLKRDLFEVLLPFLEKNLPTVRGFNGCVSVNVYFDSERAEMLLEEEWVSVEAHQSYLKFIEGNGVLGELASHLSAAPTIKYFFNGGV